MATNRKRTPRSRRVNSTLNQAQTDWLYSMPYPADNEEAEGRGASGIAYFCAYHGHGSEQYRGTQALWDQYKGAILDEWMEANPCTRPQRWWDFDAPEEEIVNCRPFPGRLAAHRRRLGGVGTPQHEVLNIVPHFTLGLPASWVSTFDEAYYNGRAIDIRGEIIPTQYNEGDFTGKAPDPADPPRFESQAAYLQRHGLLTVEERKYLTKNPHLLENEVVEPFSAVENI